MNGVHIYCMAPASHHPAATVTGLDDAAVQAIDVGALCVWFSAHAMRPVPSIERVRAHDAVVRAAMNDDITPVPVRFGQWFDDEAAAAAEVETQAEHWTERLRHFAGRAEYGVRILPLQNGAPPARDVHPVPASSGRAYMEALALRQAEAERLRGTAEEVASAIGAQVGDLIADTRTEARPDAPTVIAVAHLVAWRDAGTYHSRMQALRDARTDLRLLFSGPWPPYSFVA